MSEGPAASAPHRLRPRLLAPSTTPRPPLLRNDPPVAMAPPCPPADLLPLACPLPMVPAWPSQTLLLSHSNTLHQHVCQREPHCPEFGVGPSPDYPPVPGACHGAAWVPWGHRATRRRSTRHAGAVAPHIHTMLPPPLLQLQQVPPLGPAWSSAYGLAQCHKGVLGPHGLALHCREVLGPRSPHSVTEQSWDLMALVASR